MAYNQRIETNNLRFAFTFRKIRLEVYNEKKIVPTYNVVGFIRGRVEPDRYIIYGNHRDGRIIKK